MKKVLLGVAIAAGIFISTALQAQTTLYGITTTNQIFTMTNVSTPSVISGPYTVSGVTTGQTLVGLDAQPGTGMLYALGYDSVATSAQLYKITNVGTSYTATAVGTATGSVNLGMTNNAAFDFVSTNANQIRIVGRNGNNYIMSAATGAVLSTGSSAMSFGVGDVFAGLTNALAATAYTNSFAGADATDEVGYDAVNNVLVKFDAGSFLNGFDNTSYTLHSIGIGTGVTFMPLSSVGMDAFYDTVSHSNTVYLSGSTLPGGTHLYKYDLSGTTGTLSDLGAIGSGSIGVRDIAFATGSMSTAPLTGSLITALSLNLRNLVTFDSKMPSAIRSVKTLNGITTGQSMIAIDYSMSGQLYGLGYNSTAQTYQLYLIDTATGNVTAVNTTPHNLMLGIDGGSGNKISAAFRFIPSSPNSIRVIGGNGAVNVTMNSATGVVVTTDTALNYVTGDMSFGGAANLTSMAYTGYSSDAVTQAYGFDANTGELVMFDAGNGTGGLGNGSSGFISSDLNMNTVLSLLGHTSTYNNSYMDIVYDPAVATNIGFIAANYMGDSTDLENYAGFYDMSDMLIGSHKGTATSPTAVGGVGYGIPVKDAVILRQAYTAPTAVAAIPGNNANDLLVYPNPVVSVTRIVLPAAFGSAYPVYVSIIDMNGHIDASYEYAPGIYNLDVDMSTLPMGLYSIRVFGNGISDHNLRVLKD